MGFYFVTTGWIFEIGLYVNSINQSITDLKKPTEVFDLMNPGYRLGHYRHAASDPQYPIELPAWGCL